MMGFEFIGADQLYISEWACRAEWEALKARNVLLARSNPVPQE